MPTTFAKEFTTAMQKYTPALWAGLHRWQMHQYLKREVRELQRALWVNDLHGEHGIIVEATHVQVVAQRIIDEMTRRSGNVTALHPEHQAGDALVPNLPA